MSGHEADSIVGDLTELLQPQDGIRPLVLGPVPEERIASAEKELGLSFPKSYRAFLQHFGAAAMWGYEIAGLPLESWTDGDPPSCWSHVADDTLGYRRRGRLPDPYVVISSDGGDYWFLLDTSRVDAAGECPVLIWGPGADGVVVASSFLHFLRKIRAGEELL
jgi:hypothetical protein